uniref:Uncharacterized protein n=1 Tax=viral metagenome TaxID=1070528 RepID=A0A6C0JCR5_9ZZZZ
MDKNTFFSAKNTDLIYTICRDDVLKKTQYNIDTNKKYFKTFGEIMKIVHKHSNDTNDLTILNNKTIGKTIPYLVGEIQKKNLKEKPLIPNNHILNAPGIRNDSIRNDSIRNDSIRNDSIRNDSISGNELPVSFRGNPSNLGNSNIDNSTSLKNDFDRIMEERKNYHDIPDTISMSVEDNNTYDDPNVLLDKQMKERDMLNNVDNQHKPNLQQNMNSVDSNIPRVQRTLLETQTAPKNPELNLESFDLNDNVLSELYGNTDMNTYSASNDSIEPMKLFEDHMNQRNMEDNDYKKVQQDTINFEESQKKDNKLIDYMKEHHDVRKQQEEMEFQKSLSNQLNSKMNNLDVESIKSQMDGRIIQTLDEVIVPPTANDLERAQDNKLEIENKEYFQMKNDLFEKRQYINRENLLVINSGDRDWFNESEDRYSFQMRFRPAMGDGGETGLGVDNLYKNIVSFELIRVLMAIENIIIPFDNRFFIDYKSLPYIALKIDELQPLYSGTNSRVNNTFAKLLFDKDHTNEVVVKPLGGGGGTYTNKFSRQLTRGYSSMAPMSNEKKTFYPAPLASLNRLTISMLTPYGADIKNHTDVLEVNSVKFLALDGLSLELDNTSGFPNDDIDDTVTYYLEIATDPFNNRVFKLGDNVKFKGFDSTSTDTNIENFKNFMNRDEGHYIINLELEDNGKNKNEGYINKFYISPPGSINYSDGSKVGNYDISGELKDKGTCKVINQSLQTHFVFKVVTREDDTTQFIKPVNI